MAKFEIVGGKELNGIVMVPGSKNAALPILAACLLCEEEIILHNVPKITDVKNMLKILNNFGVKTKWNGMSLVVNAQNAHPAAIADKLAAKMRSSIFLLGSCLARFNKASFAYPGGCNIGTRPIDIHICGLRKLGVKVLENTYGIECDAKKLKSGTVVLNFPSVGATENLIMASIFTKGETIIKNAAREPEVTDLANFINAMGGKIEGAGTSTIKICGVSSLKGCCYKIIPDRIIAGTYLIAAALCGGRVELHGAEPQHLSVLTSKLRQNCCHIIEHGDKMYISSHGTLANLPSIETAPYPAFPTDLQSQFLVLAAASRGTTTITENLFESRFKIVPSLIKMGAEITINGKTAIVAECTGFIGANVEAQDLRGGAALVLAGLKACGTTIVSGVEFIDRGYYRFEQTLSKLGADIKRID